ncbi:Sec-independent protein translocase TatB [Franzmannia pantelleriensis]|uniref:Sec-independent protein translocase protein TatB n=1 Tax=Franzmannia pantelleriensis TaxID=48727 RepID=A0A1G9QF06_9GAMM|nr:Sec-independent protein translocase protein TatB [Halomonas pantelleriensis]SDM09067.1 Sec-independent protein translocase TatB [Halomonas pantelleriensis]
MLDIGFLELLLIGIVGLLVLGPERLPKAARTLGLWIGKIKRTVSGMQREINAQLEAEELRQKLNDQQKKLDESLGKVKRDVERYAEPNSGTPPKGDATSHADVEETPPTADERLDKALASKARRESVTPEQAAPSSPSSDKDSPSR